MLFSDFQLGILGKSCLPSELLTAKFSAIKLFVFKKKEEFIQLSDWMIVIPDNLLLLNVRKPR